jgi:hypothetical protein
MIARHWHLNPATLREAVKLLDGSGAWRQSGDRTGGSVPNYFEYLWRRQVKHPEPTMSPRTNDFTASLIEGIQRIVRDELGTLHTQLEAIWA